MYSSFSLRRFLLSCFESPPFPTVPVRIADVSYCFPFRIAAVAVRIAAVFCCPVSNHHRVLLFCFESARFLTVPFRTPHRLVPLRLGSPPFVAIPFRNDTVFYCSASEITTVSYCTVSNRRRLLVLRLESPTPFLTVPFRITAVCSCSVSNSHCF